YIIGSNPGSDDIKEVYAALSTLELSEQLEQAGEDAASRLANYDICFEDDKVTSEYLDSHGSQLFLADRFLDGAISRATGRLAPVATGMHLRATQMYKQIVDVEATDAERLAGLEAAFAHDNRRAERMPELLQASFAAKKLEPALVSHWWHLYIASRVADSFNLPSHRASKATLSSDQRAVAAVLGKVTVSEHTEICFAQVPDTRTNLDAAAAVWSLGAADTVKAKEALLYLSSTNGVADIALASDVLLEGAGKIRYTASGTFDTASLLMTQLMTASTDQVPLLPADKPLTTRAVEQLAPYIPQLFAMLCAKRPEQASAALAILKQLARKAPDLIVFYAVVAARSLPAASRGGQMAMALVLQTFDAAMVADIQKFLALAGSVAVLPQERMRRVCVKAKTAHDRALAALARSPDDQRAASACEECLRPIYRMLAEYAATEIPVAASEAEFIAAIPRLQRLVDRLIPTAAGEAPGETETIWRQVFRLLATPASIAMAHVCPQLSDFRTAIPIPSLTSPTEPLFFEQTGTTVRVIGSKTRPKMLSLYLANKQGAVRRHRYILKGSEDLRIDECAIQVFVRLNRVIRCSVGSSETGDRISSLGVYNVVPIDTYGGLIQVVDDAPSLFH
ncbi:Serine/threonine-protein kinase smg1, partial [Coemansia sp. RSA 2703]